MAISPRARLALRIVGYVFLALFTFVVALHLTFPYERVRDRALDALSSKYDVTIAGVERSWVPGRFTLTGVTLRSRPSVAGQPTTTMFFKRAEIDLAFAPLLSGRVAIGLDIATGAGRITGTIEQKKNETRIGFTLTRVPLTMIPGVSDAVGLPMGGNADGRVKLALVRNDWSKANGLFELACTVGCTIGDGQAKIYPKSTRPGDEALSQKGVTVPSIRIQRFKLAIDIVKGEAKRRAFELTSADGEADVDVSIKLSKTMSESTITGCIKYKCSKELYDREPNFRVTCDFGSPAVDPEGFHHIKLVGRLSAVRRLGALCDGSGKPADPFSPTTTERPRLDDPPEPIRVIDAGVPELDASVAPPPIPDPVMSRPPHQDDVPQGEGNGVNVTPPVLPPPPPPPISGSAYPSDSAKPPSPSSSGELPPAR
jgi:type II secretion system protein N